MGYVIVDERFDGALDPRWKQIRAGGGSLEVASGMLRLALPSGSARAYSDAQIDDCSGLPLSRFPWRPPLRLEVRARASHPVHPVQPTYPALSTAPGDAMASGDALVPQRFLRGTAGFGFWNVMMTVAGGAPRLPDAIWFFAAAPPSNMALVPGVPGWGWKAQVVHAHRPEAVLAGIPALAAILRARFTNDDAVAARWVQRVTGAREAPLACSFADWHDYALEWRTDKATFQVDGEKVLAVTNPPRGPLGFVAWIDNQYAIATPRGTLRFGVVETGAEWLELARLRIEMGA